MDSFQKKSVMIIISSIEQQLSSLRTLLMMTESPETVTPHKVHKQKMQGMEFTSEEEDDFIEQALKLDEKEALMQDIFKQVGQDGEQRQ